MFKDAFIKLDQLETETILEAVKDKLDVAISPQGAAILGQELSFYPGYRFLDISDAETVPGARCFLLYKEGVDPVILNWTNEPIYELNEKAPIDLSEKNVGDYVRFFFSYVRGRHGRFIIIENVDDVAWKEEPPPAARKAIGQMLTPVTLTGTDDDGSFNLTACMVFKDSLFKTDIEVKPGGLVTLSNEALLIEDMPVLDDTLGQ